MRKFIAPATFSAVLALAITVVQPWEGRENDPYLDLVGKLTVCDGHTGGVERRTYSDSECDALLKQDLAEANAIVHSCVSRPMPVSVEAAVTSFTYNVGGGQAGRKDGFCVLKSGKPSAMSQLANAGNWAAVCDQFQYWTSAGGKQIKGLRNRREAEAKLCRSGL